MKAIMLVVAAAAALMSMGAAPLQQPRFILGCDSASFAAGMGVDDLVKRFGAENVKPDSISLGEGEFSAGTVLFAADSERRVEILWKDTVALRAPSMVRVVGESSEWATKQGITLGTRLRTLEKLNGRMFRLAGFAFDGSGFVTSWANGNLDRRRAPCQIKANLSPTVNDSVDRRWYRQVTGDRDFSSGHPAMQQLDPRVERLMLEYPEPAPRIRKPSPERR